jgi:hypothetical protein
MHVRPIVPGIIRHGAKLLYAYAEATVPKLTVSYALFVCACVVHRMSD